MQCHEYAHEADSLPKRPRKARRGIAGRRTDGSLRSSALSEKHRPREGREHRGCGQGTEYVLACFKQGRRRLAVDRSNDVPGDLPLRDLASTLGLMDLAKRTRTDRSAHTTGERQRRLNPAGVGDLGRAAIRTCSLRAGRSGGPRNERAGGRASRWRRPVQRRADGRPAAGTVGLVEPRGDARCASAAHAGPASPRHVALVGGTKRCAWFRRLDDRSVASLGDRPTAVVQRTATSRVASPSTRSR